LEAVIANLEGSEEYKSVAFSSGQAATSSLLFSLKPKKIFKRGGLTSNKGYKGTSDSMEKLRRFAGFYCNMAMKTLESYSDSRSEDVMDNVLMVCSLEDLEKEVSKVEQEDQKVTGRMIYKGLVIWLETPLNPTCDLEDIGYYVNVAYKIGAYVVVDSTFASPALQQPLNLGADYVLHSATKFLGGHSDLLGGLVTAKTSGLIQEVKQNRSILGCVMGNLEAYLLLRSVRTLEVRVHHQSESAELIANWLVSQIGNPETNQIVTKVYYPTLKPDQHGLNSDNVEITTPMTSPPSEQNPSESIDESTVKSANPEAKPLTLNHEICEKQMNGRGPGILSFELKTMEQAREFPSLLTIIINATSLGGVESTIDYRNKWDSDAPPCLLRLSIGLESPKDLIRDLKSALLKLIGSTF